MADASDIFHRIFRRLSQYGPGSDASTLRALATVPNLPAYPRVLDIGCGPGRQTRTLARAIQAPVVGVDLVADALNMLIERARRDSLATQVHAVRADMTHLPFRDASFDLIWAEGSIYCMGFAAGLEAWWRPLAAGGVLAVSELSWLSEARPAHERAFFESEYPAMLGVEENRALIENAGYERLHDFALPELDWWDPYYRELEQRLDELENENLGPDQSVVNACKREIEVLRRSQGTYGYVFYIMRKPSSC